MNTTFRWALVFGIGAAVVNFFFCFIIIICALFISPIAAGLAVYYSYKEFPTQDESRFGAKIGLIVGGIGSVGSILGAASAGVLFGLPFLFMMVATMQDMSSLPEILTVAFSSRVGALIWVAIAFLLSLCTIGLCVAVGMITSKVIRNQNSSSKISPENHSC